MTTVLKWLRQSLDLNPSERLWDVVEGEICIMDECFQHFVMKNEAKLDPTSTNKVYLMKCLVTVYLK